MKYIYSLLFIFFIFHVSGNVRDTLIFQMERSIDENDPTLPFIDISFDLKISDISICKDPDKVFYVTGTTANSQGVQQGIKIWASRNLKEWNLVGRNNGYVWTFEDDGSEWQKEIAEINGVKKRAIVNPGIFYMHNTFWITYTNTNSNKSGILRSRSGRAAGPYDEVKEDGFMVQGARASLFMDTDSTTYFIWGNGMVHQMKANMSGFADSRPRTLSVSDHDHHPTSRVFVSKFNNSYYLSISNSSHTSGNIQPRDTSMPVAGRLDGVVLKSDILFGNYSRQLLIPHGGNGFLFEDFENKKWFVFAGSGKGNPLGGAQAFVPVSQAESGALKMEYKYPFFPSNEQPVVYVSRSGNNSSGNTWGNAYTSLQRAVDNAPRGAQIWIASGIYEGPVDITLHEGLYLMGGFKGDETELWQRNVQANRTIIHGFNRVRNLVIIRSSSYVRLDGLIIRAGNAEGGTNFQQYGGGLHLLGGGQTIRIVNCTFENNVSNLDGGALYASIGASPLLINCIFRDNISRNNGGAVAVYCNGINGYNTRIYNTIFDNNLAGSNGGAVYFSSGTYNQGLLYMMNCLLFRNTTLGTNGTISLDGSPDFVLANSTLSFNIGNAYGSSAVNVGKVPGKSRIVNSLFYGNQGASLFGIEGQAETVLGTSQYRNIWVQFINCLFNQNQTGNLVQRNFDRKEWPSVSVLNQSVLGVNCIENSPSFVNIEEHDYRLNSGSVARNRGSNLYYFEYTLDGRKRTRQNINIGCY